MPCKNGARSQTSSSETGAKNDESGKISKTKYACTVEAHDSTRQLLESSLPKHDDDHIAGKGYNSMVHYNLVHKFIPMLQAMKIPDAKAAVDKESWNLDKMKSKKEVILRAQRDKKKVHFALLLDICHLKKSELEPEYQKYKGRVVLRGDIVKDDSGSYAVFTEQGSSASQMTAAKVVDVIARLPDCDGQAADAVFAYNKAKMEDAPRWLRIPKSEYVQKFGYVFRDTNGQHRGQMSKIQWFLLNETCMGIPLAGL